MKLEIAHLVVSTLILLVLIVDVICFWKYVYKK
jgi:hypothetical protein